MTNPETIIEAGKQIAAVASGRARRDGGTTTPPDGSAEEAPIPPAEKLSALPNEATIESLNDGKPGA